MTEGNDKNLNGVQFEYIRVGVYRSFALAQDDITDAGYFLHIAKQHLNYLKKITPSNGQSDFLYKIMMSYLLNCSCIAAAA